MNNLQYIQNQLNKFSNIDEVVSMIINYAKNSNISFNKSKIISIVCNDGNNHFIKLSKTGVETVDECQADLTIKGNNDVILGVIQGKINPLNAILFKGLKIEGDKSLLNELNNLLINL